MEQRKRKISADGPPGGDEDEVIGPLPVGEGGGTKKRKGLGPPMAGNLNHILINAHHVKDIEFCSFYPVLPYEKVYLDGLPCAEMYEKSYMHRDIITHVICTKLVHLDLTCICIHV